MLFGMWVERSSHKRGIMKTLVRLFALVGCFFISGCASLDSTATGDQDVVAEVTQRLAADPATAQLRLGVTVEDDVVTLSGRIDNPSVRLRAVSIARSVPGVMEVNDQTVRY